MKFPALNTCGIEPIAYSRVGVNCQPTKGDDVFIEHSDEDERLRLSLTGEESIQGVDDVRHASYQGQADRPPYWFSAIEALWHVPIDERTKVLKRRVNLIDGDLS